MQVNWEKIKPALWSAAGGAIVLAIIGFQWAGWVTGGTAQEMAAKAAKTAVVDRLAAICVEQFNRDSEKVQKFKKLKEESKWVRGDYVKEQGWATMPGEKEADIMVARKCAVLVVELGQ